MPFPSVPHFVHGACVRFCINLARGCVAVPSCLPLSLSRGRSFSDTYSVLVIPASCLLLCRSVIAQAFYDWVTGSFLKKSFDGASALPLFAVQCAPL